MDIGKAPICDHRLRIERRIRFCFAGYALIFTIASRTRVMKL